MISAKTFVEARDLLLRHRVDYGHAYDEFRWPELGDFNWALDYFEVMARENDDTARRIVDGVDHQGRRFSLRRDDGYYVYVGRADDVFKSSDYRLSPFELESVLIEHEAIAEAALVPSADALRLAAPKAFVVCGRETKRRTTHASRVQSSHRPRRPKPD